MNKNNIDYSNTLNLPQTNFPMKAGLPKKEQAILEKWQEMNLYKIVRDKTKDRKKFILHDGPPYANGKIHIGHALNKILKDFVIKGALLNGYDAPYVMGWDCHGLPIEHKVLKDALAKKEKLLPNEIRKRCRIFAKEQLEIQKKDFKRLGVLGDFDNPYLTMSKTCESKTIEAFKKIFAKGYIKYDYKPVHWSWSAVSALAEAELEYNEKVSPSIYVIVPSKISDISKCFNIHLEDCTLSGLLIWTTTPWTLPANTAVSILQSAEYYLVKINEDSLAVKANSIFVVAADLFENLKQKLNIKMTILAKTQGKNLLNLRVNSPIVHKRIVPVLHSEFVELQVGTGLVHYAMDHGKEDFLICKQNNLESLDLVNDYGKYRESIKNYDGLEDLAGINVTKANDLIISKLKNLGTLLYQEEYNHSYPFCWRTKKPVIIRATKQWFFDLNHLDLMKKTLQIVKKDVEWLSKNGKARMLSILESAPNWCISRQRYWGTPIPLLVHKETGKIHPNSNVLLDKVIEIVSKEGIEGWFNLNIEDLIGSEAKDYLKIEDILDVWFDSGVTHYSVLKQNKDLGEVPADIYLEGKDQYRGWFQSSLKTAVALYSKAPYKKVLDHGFTVDDKGYKMSKSLGNIVEPQKIIEKYGADVLRLWVATQNYNDSLSISEKLILRVIDIYRRIRNTARFMLGNTHDFSKFDLLNVDKLLPLDLFALENLVKIQQKIRKAYENYDYKEVIKLINNWCIQDMGGFYLDIIKDRIYTMKKNSIGRKSAQSVLYYCLKSFNIWLYPILTFTSEEIYYHNQNQIDENNKTTIIADLWNESIEKLNFSNNIISVRQWDLLLKLKEEVNLNLEQACNNKVIKAFREAKIELYLDSNSYNLLKSLEKELAFFFLTAEVDLCLAKDNNNTFVAVKVLLSKNIKCLRCWRYDSSVVSENDICNRCKLNLSDNEGEIRKYF